MILLDLYILNFYSLFTCLTQGHSFLRMLSIPTECLGDSHGWWERIDWDDNTLTGRCSYHPAGSILPGASSTLWRVQVSCPTLGRASRESLQRRQQECKKTPGSLRFRGPVSLQHPLIPLQLQSGSLGPACVLAACPYIMSASLSAAVEVQWRLFQLLQVKRTRLRSFIYLK